MQTREEYDRINKNIEDLEKEIRERKQLLEKAKGRATQLAGKRHEANSFMPWEQLYELQKLEEQLSEQERMKLKERNLPDRTLIDEKESRLAELMQKKSVRDKMFTSLEDTQLDNYINYKQDTEAKERQLQQMKTQQRTMDRNDIKRVFGLTAPLDMVPDGMITEVVNGETVSIPSYRPKTDGELIQDKNKYMGKLGKMLQARRNFRRGSRIDGRKVRS